jgi:hypothetical protein
LFTVAFVAGVWTIGLKNLNDYAAVDVLGGRVRSTVRVAVLSG